MKPFRKRPASVAAQPKLVAHSLLTSQLLRAGVVVPRQPEQADPPEGEDSLIEDKQEQMEDAVVATRAMPGHVVVTQIGDPDSKSGREMMQRYGSVIGTPLALSGSAPSALAIKEAVLKWCPWAETAAHAIASSVALSALSTKGGITLRPLALVGPPGSGRSGLAAKAAGILGLANRVIPCGGNADHAGILATARGWSTAQPSNLFLTAFETQTANPLVVFDEVDKSGAALSMDGKNGTVTGALISLLSDPGSFWDDCLLAPLDVSRFSFVVTVNTLKSLPKALLDRFTVVEVERPRAEHFEAILANVVEAEADVLGLPVWAMPDLDGLDRKVLEKTWLRAGRSIRVLKRAVATVLGEKAMERAHVH